MKVTREQVEAITAGMESEHPIVAATLRREIDRIVEFLPDIDEVERKEIETLKTAAKINVGDWRVLKSVADSLWEINLKETDPTKRAEIYRAWETVSGLSEYSLDQASFSKSRAETLEKFGLEEHEDKLKYIFYAVIPLIALLVLKRK
jgi:Rad3-related DNA helicase